MEIFCTNTGEYVTANGGESLLEIYDRVKDQIHATTPGFNPIGAHVNNKGKSLNYVVYGPRQVEFFDSVSPSGTRVYVRSLCMIMCKAVSDLFPGTHLRIEHPVSQGYFCTLSGEDINDEIIEKIAERMRQIIAEDIAFERLERLTTDVAEEFRAKGMDDKVSLLEDSDELYTVYYRLGDFIDTFYGDLAPSTGYITVFNLIPYKTGMLLLSQDTENPTQAFEPTVQDCMFDAFTRYQQFNTILGLRDVASLNKAVRENHTAMLINVVECLHHTYLSDIASEIVKRYHERGCRVVLIAGPSSSGKTTTSRRLAVHLATKLITPKVIELDNYFVNRDCTPRDENGELDFESLYALDLDQFNTDINRLIAGEEVRLPTYNFETGKREYRGNTLRLDHGDILLLEGIHGLNPELTKGIHDDKKFLVYVSALTTLCIDNHNWIPTSDTRLLRRIIRDIKYRAQSAADTIRRWPSVRRGENKWIFPFQENADATFNSSLLFEIAVLRNQALAALKKVPRNAPEYTTASRLMNMLSYLREIPDADIPNSSLLREFLGGSVFEKWG